MKAVPVPEASGTGTAWACQRLPERQAHLLSVVAHCCSEK